MSTGKSGKNLLMKMTELEDGNRHVKLPALSLEIIRATPPKLTVQGKIITIRGSALQIKLSLEIKSSAYVAQQITMESKTFPSCSGQVQFGTKVKMNNL